MDRSKRIVQICATLNSSILPFLRFFRRVGFPEFFHSSDFLTGPVSTSGETAILAKPKQSNIFWSWCLKLYFYQWLSILLKNKKKSVSGRFKSILGILASRSRDWKMEITHQLWVYPFRKKVPLGVIGHAHNGRPIGRTKQSVEVTPLWEFFYRGFIKYCVLP